VRFEPFESYYCSGRTVFHVELAKDMFDVFADGAGLCAQNNANIVIALALRNPEENLGFARRQR